MRSRRVEQIPQREPVASRLVKSPFVACLVLAGATILALWPVVHAGFINYDDNDYVTSNAWVQAGLTWKSVGWAFTSNHASNWHPLTWLTHMLDVQLFGKQATGPHCVNLLLHVLNTILLFCLLRRITAAHWRSFFVAGLFALHPLHVESVAWVSERKDVLSTLFWMLTLLAYAQYADNTKSPGSKSKLLYMLTLVLFALGLMSKPMLVTLPFVMLLLDFWPLRRFELSNFKQPSQTIIRLVLEKVPFFLLSAASCAVTSWAQQKAIQPLEYLPMTDRWANAVVAYARYIGKALLPSNLALPYLHPGNWPTNQVTMAVILLAGMCLVAVFTVRKHPYVFVGWFWYLGTLVPVIGLVQVGTQSIADRYTYIPLIGVFVIATWGLTSWFIRWRLPGIASFLVVLLPLTFCGVLTHQQAKRWHDSESLFKHSAAVTEGNYVALGNVGGVLFEAGKLDEAMDFYQRSHQANPRYPEAINSIGAVLSAKGREDEAMEWFRKTLDLQPTHADALFNMGNAMAKKGNVGEAVRYFRAALEIEPDNFEARNNLGNGLVKLGRLDEATEQYRLALKHNPDAGLIHKNLGEMLAAKGKLDEAISQYRQALIQTNDAGTHYSLGLTLAVQGKWDEAIEHYAETLRLSPTNADAHYNLGYAFRVQGRHDQAVTHFSEALRFKPEFPMAHFNLGCVLADKNQREEALNHLREALRLDPNYEEARQKLKALESQKNERITVP